MHSYFVVWVKDVAWCFKSLDSEPSETGFPYHHCANALQPRAVTAPSPRQTISVGIKGCAGRFPKTNTHPLLGLEGGLISSFARGVLGGGEKKIPPPPDFQSC